MSFGTAVVMKKSGGEGLNGKRTYTVVYRVYATTNDDGPKLALAATGIPAIGDAYSIGNESDERAYCSDRQASAIVAPDSGKIYEVTCMFNTLDREEQRQLVHPITGYPPGGSTPSPSWEPTEISWSQRHFSEAVVQDVNGNGVVNSAGEYFDPPIERSTSRPVLTITKNESQFPTALAIAFADAVNADAFSGAARHTLKVMNIGGQRQIKEFDGTQIEYWRVTYEFEYKWDNWNSKPLDQGYTKLVAGATQRIKDANGLPITSPAMLNGSGGVLANPTSATAVFLDYEIYYELPFSALGI